MLSGLAINLGERRPGDVSSSSYHGYSLSGSKPIRMPSSSMRLGSPKPPTFLLHHTDEITAPFVTFTTSTRTPDINSSLSSPLATASNKPTGIWISFGLCLVFQFRCFFLLSLAFFNPLEQWTLWQMTKKIRKSPYKTIRAFAAQCTCTQKSNIS